MTQQHTQGRLRVGGRVSSGALSFTALYDEAGSVVLTLVDSDGAYPASERAPRLAAAWNSVEGIQTEALEAGAVQDCIAALANLLLVAANHGHGVGYHILERCRWCRDCEAAQAVLASIKAAKE